MLKCDLASICNYTLQIQHREINTQLVYKKEKCLRKVITSKTQAFNNDQWIKF